MSVPLPVYCRICGAFMDKHEQGDSAEKKIYGRHEWVEDCVETLADRIKELEKTLHENGIYR